MSRRVRFSRRDFMQIAAAAAATGPIVSCVGSRSPWRFFTADEARTLEAVCERIIPSDQDPGAAWAGVVNYIDVQLVGYYRKQQKTYRQAIAGVDETARSKFGKRFVELTADRQDEVLKALEKNHAPGESWKRISSQQFLDLVVSHTMQGFYGDPRHGGNRERASWKMLRLPYPPVRGRLRYDLTKSTSS